MMGYTHAAIGAGGALAVAASFGYATPDVFLLATAAGAVGGVAPDVDVKDNEKVKDGTRSRIAALIIAAVGLLLDQLLGYGAFSEIFQRQYAALAGLIAFIAILVVGHFTKHRTFTHSLLFVAITTGCIFAVSPSMYAFYFVGCFLHIVLDLLNNESNNHGIWLFYPLKTGKGIAFGVCKAARTGNKVFYFIGFVIYAIAAALCVLQFHEARDYIAPAVIVLVMMALLHYARSKSEKEQRHLMYINGEL